MIRFVTMILVFACSTTAMAQTQTHGAEFEEYRIRGMQWDCNQYRQSDNLIINGTGRTASQIKFDTSYLRDSRYENQGTKYGYTNCAMDIQTHDKVPRSRNWDTMVQFVCELPTARQLAQLGMRFGAKGIAEIRDGKPDATYELVKTENDEFYYSSSGFQPPVQGSALKSGYGSLSNTNLWSASQYVLPFRSRNPQLYYQPFYALDLTQGALIGIPYARYASFVCVNGQ